jgi:hypothetical protein
MIAVNIVGHNYTFELIVHPMSQFMMTLLEQLPVDKYCRRRGCSFQQHYGYHAQGNVGEMSYDKNWCTLPYFLSTRETAFSIDMLCRLDKEILIGQISYKQRADIFNEIHAKLVDVFVCMYNNVYKLFRVAFN